MENGEIFFDDDEDLDAEDFLAGDDIFPEDKRSLMDPPVCLSCGCSELEPCPGGCIWATENLCSRCV